ncbi:MAG TPA: glycosyl hydrolase family 18 protein [Bacillales bacterium]|nr:glycosyl hydrolase family 18 protein [Bacillales bacterium]
MPKICICIAMLSLIIFSACSSGIQGNGSNLQSKTIQNTGYDPKKSPSNSNGDPKPTIDTIGFLEPTGTGKSADIVNRTARNLSFVAFFSYRVKPDGSLIPLKDANSLQAVKNSPAKPLLVITNFAGGTFSPDIGHAILTHSAVQNQLINNVIQVMKTKNYAALNVDFEHLLPEDRDRYTTFLRKLVPRLHKAGFPVSSALAPKTSAKQSGPWYTAHDYGAHGKIMDFVILMTYEWGWTGGPPMAVAPINQVKKVLDFAVTKIPRKNIMMGMPMYGYDWTLPYKKGGPPAKRIGLQEAAQLAKATGAKVLYDEKAQSPHFYYTDHSGKKHVVWYENRQSLQAKFNLVKQYGLRGISYWELGPSAPENWSLLRQNFHIKRH